MATVNRLTGGRVWASRLLLLGLLAALAGLIVAIAPALAAPGDDIPPATTTQGVTPTEVDLGGQDNDCPAVGLGDLYDFRIVEPNGTFTDTQSGFTVTFEVSTYKVQGEEFMDFTVTGASVTGVVIKGGDNSAFHLYSPAVSTDTGTHATLKSNGKLYQVSHASFCYDVVGTISGTKFHDRDTDGLQDPTEEFGLGGWTVTAFDSSGNSVGSATTDSNGDYTITDVPLGQTYTVCESPPSDDEVLPKDDPDGAFTWTWTQSNLTSYGTWMSDAGCGDNLPGGHQFLMNASVDGIDFGNHREVTVHCGGTESVTVTLGGPDVADDPRATVTVQGGCQSGTFTSTFDVGRSDPDAGDPDSWTQFVVFGGDPDGNEVIDQTIEWDEEPAEYNGGGDLVVPTTLVQLEPGGSLVPTEFCDAGEPNSSTPQCQISRVISQDDPDFIQLTEDFQFLGDPGNFR